MAAVNALCYGAAMMATGGPAIPDDPGKAAILLIFPIGYFMAILGFFSAIPLVGPTRASMLSNLEPIAAMLLAAWMLDEHVGPMGWAGATLVVGALLAVQLAASGRAAKP